MVSQLVFEQSQYDNRDEKDLAAYLSWVYIRRHTDLNAASRLATGSFCTMQSAYESTGRFEINLHLPGQGGATR